MKRFILLLVAAACLSTAFAQKVELSAEAHVHWLVANRLMKNVQNNNDYLDVIKSYKRVLFFDRDMPEALYNIGLLSAHYAKKMDNFYSYWEAGRYFQRYQEVSSEDMSIVKEELSDLESHFAPLKGGSWQILLTDGGLYEGQTSSNGKKREGAGVMAWENGVTYEGFWKNDRPTSGRTIWPDGTIVYGDIAFSEGKDAMTVSKAMVEFSDGRWFEGSLYNGNPLKGEMTYINGDKFVGSYEKLSERSDDFMNNRTGLYTSNSGLRIPNCPQCVKFQGSWKEGKKEGVGTCWDMGNNVIYKGNFFDDKPTDEYPTKK